jgi:hypothetical protein
MNISEISNTIKNCAKSKTIRGILVSLLAKATGRVFSSDDQTVDQIIDAIAMTVEVGGAFYAVYGRVVAKDKIIQKE